MRVSTCAVVGEAHNANAFGEPLVHLIRCQDGIGAFQSNQQADRQSSSIDLQFPLPGQVIELLAGRDDSPLTG